MIALATFVAFLPAVRAPFQFDDIQAIAHNRTIEQLWPVTVPLQPPAATSVSGRPVVNVSLALNYAVNSRLGIDQRADPNGPNKTVSYHVINVLLHLMTGLLLFGIIRRAFRSVNPPEDWERQCDDIAFAVVALWLLHPIQTEAVDYIIQRTELLVSLFYLATIYASIRAWGARTRRSRLTWYAASSVACLLGMGSKEVMVSAPIVVVLYDRVFQATSWRDLRARAPDRLAFYGVLVLTMAPLAISLAGGARADSVGFNHDLPWYRYFYTQAWAILHYLRLVVWPIGLTYDYGQTPITGPRGALGLVALVLLGAATIVAWKRAPRLAFVGTVFFLLLAPSSSVIPIRTEVAAERRMYLALAPFLLLLVLATLTVARRFVRGSGLERRRYLGMTLVAAAVALFIGTALRSRMYENPELLWRDSIARVPSNARAYDNLAAVVLEKDSTRWPEAEALFGQAIAVDSTYIPAWTNLADLELRRQRPTVVRALLEHALRINPNAVDATRRLGGVLVKLGNPADGIPYLERAAAADPTDDSFVALGFAYVAVGRHDDAISTLRRAVAINPARSDAAAYLGTLLSEDGRPDDALAYLEAAVRDSTVSRLTLAFLSRTYAQLGRRDDAVAAARAANRRTGSDASTYLVLGQSMMLAERLDDAAMFLQRADESAPGDPETITRLGMVKAAMQRADEAEALFRKALAIRPGYEPAQRALAKLAQMRGR